MIETDMRTFEEKLAAISPSLVNDLNPPATPAQIDEVAANLPFDFPEELRRLYSVHDGESKERGLFFGLPFSDLATALDKWKLLAGISKDVRHIMDAEIVSVPRGYIKKNYINTCYFPIGQDGGGNYIGIDLDPDKKGIRGQVINFGSDEDTRYVIAPSLQDFLAFCIRQLEIGNYIVKKPLGKETLYLKEPDNEHFLDTLSQLSLPFQAG